jgi:integrase
MPAPRTMRAAWLEVNRTIEWRQLKASSKAQQIGVAERFLTSTIAPDSKVTFGQMPLDGLRRGDVKKIIGRYVDHPHAGEAVLRLLRKLCGVALDLEWIESDPTFRVKFRPALIGHRAWTDDELAQYERKWPLGTRERLAYALALYTGQRRADVAAMAEGAYSGNGIAVVQEKTGAPLWIPVHPALREALDAGPKAQGWLLTSSHASRYTKESFGNFMADSIAAAELPDDCRLHGLRKSAGRALAEAGCTAHQIMAILGHKSLAEAQRYTKEADQKRLAQQAMDKWSAPKLVVLPGRK